jgi:hypothetical protein
MSHPCKILLLLLTVFGSGCGPFAPESGTYQLNSVSLPTTADETSSPQQFVGRNSCSATACHGQPHAELVSWRNAYDAWEAADPHRRAFDVLYTERSVQMYRKLTETTAPAIDDRAYLRFVEEKCIGCHATPPSGSLAGGKLVQQTTPDAYWQGVSCESCHGPASGWLGDHYSRSWPDLGEKLRAEKTAATGFHDLRSLQQRAETCLQCHHGPQQIGDHLYDVNHDLIAAGHPRLQFELHAYLTNLPKHWDEAAEIDKYVKSKPQPPALQSFHFDTWQAGQIQHALQDARLQQIRAKSSAGNEAGNWAEFANKDCRLCHHTAGEPSFRLQYTKQSTVPDDFFLQPMTSAAERAGLVQKLLSQSNTSDQAIAGYLAAAAFAGDLPQGTLTAELAQLQQSLAAQCGASQYDLPAKFNPVQPEYQQALESLQQALQQLAR